MATEFNTSGPVRKDKATRGSLNPPTARVGTMQHWSTFVILGLLAVVVVFGVIFTVQDTSTTASNEAVTTGIARSPSNPPPAPGPAGQGESNSTR